MAKLVDDGFPMLPRLGECVCCGRDAKFSILLAVGPNNEPSGEMPRYYIPNQTVRDSVEEGFPDPTELIVFCPSCMRGIEDSVRGAILTRQLDFGRISVEPITAKKSKPPLKAKPKR